MLFKYIIFLIISIFSISLLSNEILPTEKVSIKNENNKPKTITRVKEKTESSLVPDQESRVLVSPSLSTFIFFTDSKNTDTIFLVSSDFDYITPLIGDFKKPGHSVLTLFGNYGFGFLSDQFSMQFQLGIKWKFENLAYNLKMFLKTGVSFNPVFTDKTITLFSGFLGIGLEYFLNDYFGLGLSSSIYSGTTIGTEENEFISSIQFSLNLIWVF